MGEKPRNLLLIEDNESVQKFNMRLFENEGYVVKAALTLKAADEIFTYFTPDAVILDIGMPDGSGLDYLRTIRVSGNQVPVLLLTGYGKNEEVVLGFEAGCDDYLIKPYTFEVLHARVKKLLQHAEQIPETLSRGTLLLKLLPGEAYVNGENMLLTPRDFSLLQFFVTQEGRIISFDFIYESVWGQTMAGNSKAISTAVARLRKKLTGSGYSIVTEYGTGYRFKRDE